MSAALTGLTCLAGSVALTGAATQATIAADGVVPAATLDRTMLPPPKPEPSWDPTCLPLPTLPNRPPRPTDNPAPSPTRPRPEPTWDPTCLPLPTLPGRPPKPTTAPPVEPEPTEEPTDQPSPDPSEEPIPVPTLPTGRPTPTNTNPKPKPVPTWDPTMLPQPTLPSRPPRPTQDPAPTATKPTASKPPKPARGRLIGTVQDMNGEPIAGMKMGAYTDEFTLVDTSTTNSTGGYYFSNLPPQAKVFVRVLNSGAGAVGDYAQQWYPGTSAFTFAIAATPPTDRPLELPAYKVSYGGNLRVNVTLKGGEPNPPGVRVELYDQSNVLIEKDFSEDSLDPGTFDMIGTGKYQVKVVPKDKHWPVAWYTAEGELRPSLVAIKRGETTHVAITVMATSKAVPGEDSARLEPNSTGDLRDSAGPSLHSAHPGLAL